MLEKGFLLPAAAGIIIIRWIEEEEREGIMGAAELEDVGVQGTGETVLGRPGTVDVDFDTDGDAAGRQAPGHVQQGATCGNTGRRRAIRQHQPWPSGSSPARRRRARVSGSN